MTLMTFSKTDGTQRAPIHRWLGEELSGRNSAPGDRIARWLR